jgi:hypothetical protein
MAAIRIIIALLYTSHGALPSGNQKGIGLGEFRLQQAIKDIGNVDFEQAAFRVRLSMCLPCSQKRPERLRHDGAHRQSAVSGMPAQQFHGSRRELQRDRHRGVYDFDRSIEPGGLLQIPICLAP